MEAPFYSFSSWTGDIVDAALSIKNLSPKRLADESFLLLVKNTEQARMNWGEWGEEFVLPIVEVVSGGIGCLNNHAWVGLHVRLFI